ncbi:MAG: NADP-dependent oxidoreductase [Alphaproteobacteria bacterium]|nr:NADP-dependent oxidoreductase [Alphaproteobacteria bacterium]
MKAIRVDEYGGPDVLVMRDVPDPEAAPGRIVVAIEAASVNPIDWKTRAGMRRDASALPLILGCDFSGTVSAVGAGVEEFTAGDAVFGVAPQEGDGTYAEAIAIDAGLVAPKPDRLSHVEAAAHALVGLTALVSLEDTAKVQAGESVLIQGGAGGVGGFAVQYAKHAGATVFATTSTRNVQYVAGLGADTVIDYTKEDFAEAVPPCDVVFDTVGGEVQERSFSVLKPGGRLVYIARGSDGAPPPPDHIRMLRPQVNRDRAHMERIVGLLEAGALIAPEITRLPWTEIAKAHELIATGHVRGKIVLDVGQVSA